MTYNQQARALLDELNLHGKLTTEHYSMIEAGLNELDARAEEAERKVKALEMAIRSHSWEPKPLEFACYVCANEPCPNGLCHAENQYEDMQIDYDRLIKEAEHE